MTAVLKIEQVQERNRRISTRRKLNLKASLAATGDEVVIHDLSSTGLLIETRAKLSPFDRLEVILPERGPTEAIIIWNSGKYFGCQFVSAISRSALSAALLRNPATQPAPGLLRPADNGEVGESDEAGEVEDAKFSLKVRLRVILGMTVLLWALILWSAGII